MPNTLNVRSIMACAAFVSSSHDVLLVRVSSCQPPNPTSDGVILSLFLRKISSISCGETKLLTENARGLSEICVITISAPGIGEGTFLGVNECPTLINGQTK